MINFIRLLTLTLLFFANTCIAEVSIHIVHPQQDSVVVAEDSTFIFGSVSPTHANLLINGKPISLYPNGAFLAMLPVEQGNFSFLCEAYTDSDTTVVVRDVIIPKALQTTPDSVLSIDPGFLFPQADWELYEKDIFRVAFKGTPNCKASFTIDGLVWDVPMLELSPESEKHWRDSDYGQQMPAIDPPVAGIYSGTLYLQPWHRCQQRAIQFMLVNDRNDTTRATATGRISIFNSAIPQFAQFISDYSMAVPDQHKGAQYFFPKATQVQILKRRGHELKIKLTNDHAIWIRDHALELLPPGITQNIGILSDIQTEELDRYSRLFITLGRRVPYRIEQWKKPATLKLNLYQVIADSIHFNLDFAHSEIQNIHPRVVSLDEVEIKIPIKQGQQWGYRSLFENGNFILDFKRPPAIISRHGSPLKGLAICLDPGHGPDDGAIGPTGLTEREITPVFCSQLYQKLIEKGAQVFMTREKDEGVELYTRPHLADIFQADILLSFHFNALPDGFNPFKSRGIGTYFYHPMSERLAYDLQERLWRKTKLNDYGVFRENLVLCRPTNMIAVLTEPAFIIHPEEEMLIQSRDYQKKVVDAIVEGLERFVKNARRK